MKGFYMKQQLLLTLILLASCASTAYASQLSKKEAHEQSKSSTSSSSSSSSAHVKASHAQSAASSAAAAAEMSSSSSSSSSEAASSTPTKNDIILTVKVNFNDDRFVNSRFHFLCDKQTKTLKEAKIEAETNLFSHLVPTFFSRILVKLAQKELTLLKKNAKLQVELNSEVIEINIPSKLSEFSKVYFTIKQLNPKQKPIECFWVSQELLKEMHA